MKLTYEGFINSLCEYYGEYDNDKIRQLILAYLKNNINPDALGYLLNRIFLGYSKQWKNTPDIAIIEQYKIIIKKDATEFSAIPEIEKFNSKKLITEEIPDENVRNFIGDLAGELANNLKIGKVKKKNYTV